MDFRAPAALLPLFFILFAATSAPASPAGVGRRLVLQLSRVDDGKNLTAAEFLRRAVDRSHRRSAGAAAHAVATGSVRAGVFEYVMEMGIGSPPSPATVIVDTGSDLIWTQCLPCEECYSQPDPIFDPSRSSSFRPADCAGEMCKALPEAICDGDNGTRCNYVYRYGSGGTAGYLAGDRFTIGGASLNQTLTFGCSSSSAGNGLEQASGIVGLGRGPLSLTSQLAVGSFAYCLTPPASRDPSPLVLNAGAARPSEPWTALLPNPTNPFYNVKFLGFSINATGGADGIRFAARTMMIVDSGTTLTYLPSPVYAELAAEVAKRVPLPPSANRSRIGVETCFDLPAGNMSVEDIAGALPKVTLEFEGVMLELRKDSLFFADEATRMLCFMMGGSGDGPAILGNFQQQGFRVLYDLQQDRISFKKTKYCQRWREHQRS